MIVTSGFFTEIGFFQTVSALIKTVCTESKSGDPNYYILTCCKFDVDADGIPTSDATCTTSICPVGGGTCADTASQIPIPSAPLQGAPLQSAPLQGGGVLKTENNLTFSQANISSSSSGNDTLALEQSDLVSDAVENTTRTADDGVEEQDESQPTEEQDSEETDVDKNNEEESPPEEG